MGGARGRSELRLLMLLLRFVVLGDVRVSGETGMGTWSGDNEVVVWGDAGGESEMSSNCSCPWPRPLTETGIPSSSSSGKAPDVIVGVTIRSGGGTARPFRIETAVIEDEPDGDDASSWTSSLV